MIFTSGSYSLHSKLQVYSSVIISHIPPPPIRYCYQQPPCLTFASPPSTTAVRIVSTATTNRHRAYRSHRHHQRPRRRQYPTPARPSPRKKNHQPPEGTTQLRPPTQPPAIKASITWLIFLALKSRDVMRAYITCVQWQLCQGGFLPRALRYPSYVKCCCEVVEVPFVALV